MYHDLQAAGYAMSSGNSSLWSATPRPSIFKPVPRPSATSSEMRYRSRDLSGKRHHRMEEHPSSDDFDTFDKYSPERCKGDRDIILQGTMDEFAFRYETDESTCSILDFTYLNDSLTLESEMKKYLFQEP